MILICEGPDKCGKSTFIKNLNLGTQVIHNDKNTPAANYYEQIQSTWLFKEPTAIDRSWISEEIYGPIYRDSNRITDEVKKNILTLLKKVPHVILFFTRPWDNIQKELESNEFEVDKSKMLKVYFEYQKKFTEYKLLGLNVYKIQFGE